MTSGLGRAVGALFWLAALAGPLDLLQYMPGLGVSLLTLIAVLLAPLTVYDASAQQKLRVPFEVWTPAAALLAMAGWDAVQQRSVGGVVEIATGCALLVSVVHFAPSRERIRGYIFAFALSGVAVVVVSLVARLLNGVPTAFSVRSGVTLTFAYSLSSGVHILLLTVAAAVFVAREKRFAPVQRAAMTGAVVIVSLALITTAGQWFWQARTAPVVAYPALRWEQWVVLLAGAWLGARIVAKVAVDARARRVPMHDLWLGAGAVTLVVAATAPPGFGAYLGLLGGWACAGVMPGRLTVGVPGRGWTWGMALGPAVLAAANLLVVSPENARDERQYDAASRRDFEAGRFGRLLARLDTIERYAGSERRAGLWRARVAMAAGAPNWASFEFASAVRPMEGRPLLPAPDDVERRDFTVLMRDAVSGMPEEASVCAFERTLLAAGDADAALYSLRLETAVSLTHVGSVDPAPFAAAVARIVGDPGLEDALRLWSAEELVTLMALWGATIDASGDPTRVIAAQRTLEGLGVYVFNAGRTEWVWRALPRPSALDLDALASGARLTWRPEGGDGYALMLGPDPIAALALRPDGSVRFDWTDAEAVVPFTPAVWVGPGE